MLLSINIMLAKDTVYGVMVCQEKKINMHTECVIKQLYNAQFVHGQFINTTESIDNDIMDYHVTLLLNKTKTPNSSKDQIGYNNKQITHLTVRSMKYDPISIFSAVYQAKNIKNENNALIASQDPVELLNIIIKIDNNLSYNNEPKIEELLSIHKGLDLGDEFFVHSNLQYCKLMGIKTLGSYSFASNKQLQTIICNELESVGSDFATECKQLHTIEAVKLQAAEDAFAVSTKIVSLRLPELRTVKNRFASSCKSLTKIEADKLQSVGKNFLSRTQIVSLSLPSLITVGDMFISSCEVVKFISLPSLTTIGDNFAYNCEALESLLVPALTKITRDFLSDCKKLKFLDMRSLTNISNFNSKQELIVIANAQAVESLLTQCPNIATIYVIGAGVDNDKVKYINAETADEIAKSYMH